MKTEEWRAIEQYRGSILEQLFVRLHSGIWMPVDKFRLNSIAMPIIQGGAPDQYSSQPGSEGIDAFLANDNPTYNYGVTDSWFTTRDTRPFLIKFDLSSIPDSATIIDATLTLTVTWSGGGTWHIYAWRIASGNADWPEGTSDGAQEAGACCYNYHTYDTQEWAGSAGLGTADTDYLTPGLGDTSNITDIGGVDITLDTDQIKTMLTADYGIKANFDYDSGGGYYIGVATSDHATAASRPKLVINYSTGGNPWYAYAQQ